MLSAGKEAPDRGVLLTDDENGPCTIQLAGTGSGGACGTRRRVWGLELLEFHQHRGGSGLAGGEHNHHEDQGAARPPDSP